MELWREVHGELLVATHDAELAGRREHPAFASRAPEDYPTR
jgi:hypothetical protein